MSCYSSGHGRMSTPPQFNFHKRHSKVSLWRITVSHHVPYTQTVARWLPLRSVSICLNGWTSILHQFRWNAQKVSPGNIKEGAGLSVQGRQLASCGTSVRASKYDSCSHPRWRHDDLGGECSKVVMKTQSRHLACRPKPCKDGRVGTRRIFFPFGCKNSNARQVAKLLLLTSLFMELLITWQSTLPAAKGLCPTRNKSEGVCGVEVFFVNIDFL